MNPPKQLGRLVLLFLCTVSILAGLPGQAWTSVLDDGIRVEDEDMGVLLGNEYYLFLHYYDSLSATIEGLELATTEGTSTRSLAWSPSAVAEGNSLTADNINNPAEFSNYSLVFPGCWGLCGKIALAGIRHIDVSVHFAPGGDVLTLSAGGTTSKVTANNIYVQALGQQGSTITVNRLRTEKNCIPLGGPWATTPVIGDVGMELDLSQVQRAGRHTGGRFTLSVEVI